MFRLLVVEDQADFYQDYLLRVFENLLPMEKISVVHVPTLAAALVALQEQWDFILMDYSMGAKTDFLGDPVRDGGDLVAFRRAIELDRGLPGSWILGTSSNQVGNTLMLGRGADDAVLKLEVPQMAAQIGEVLKKSE